MSRGEDEKMGKKYPVVPYVTSTLVVYYNTALTCLYPVKVAVEEVLILEVEIRRVRRVKSMLNDDRYDDYMKLGVVADESL